jgi:acyl dehydratase
MPKCAISSLAELKSMEGREVAVSDWLTITQQRIDAFADATDDHQWIHVDQERCSRESPFGGTIAHGFLTLSLLPKFTYETLDLRQQFAMTINYGSNRVRFVSPVRCGASIRARFLLLELAEVKGGYQARWQVTVEIDGQDKPACVAETITRYYTEAP